MESLLENYSPLDLVEVEKQLSKQIKKYQNDKDLEAEVQEVQVTLKDLSKLTV